MVLRENKTQKRAAGAKKNGFLNKSELMIFFWKIKNISKKKMGNPGTLMIFFLENQEYFKDFFLEILKCPSSYPPWGGGVVWDP